jgi:protein-glutamine gamma-glutamyltransferase
MPTQPNPSPNTISIANSTSLLSRGRKTNEAIVLALVALAAVGCLRFPVESPWLFALEVSAILLVFLAEFAQVFTARYLSVVLALVPIATSVLSRTFGTAIAFEMTALMVFGAVSLVMSIRTSRTRAMSLVGSGFLTLFAVSISDSPQAVMFAIAWMAICVWHLVANHWERLELCAVQQVRRGASVRPASVAAAIALCVLSAWFVKDRFSESKRLAGGFMPTSGGSKWSDPGARNGVGTGEAAIAAKDHAESFGAVESDLFLESTESTLFDMFNDSIGDVKKKNKWERRQGITPEKLIHFHQQATTSEKGGGSTFSTDRLPPKKNLKLDNATEKSVLQWAGPSGIRLAMNRYDTYEGTQWVNKKSLRNESLVRKTSGDAVWFFDPKLVSSNKELTPANTSVNLVKILRLDSTRIPTPMMASGLHIKDVDRQDFYGIEDDGCFFMPGREKVPPLTVVNVASPILMEDEILSQLPNTQSQISNDRRLASTVKAWTLSKNHVYEKVQSIVSHLRNEFTFDRSFETRSDDPIAEFLESRRGGDHLFATTAALMMREIGLQSRLVTGFYVRPSAIDIAAGHTNVLPNDVHVWAEVYLGDGRWFEIEPTPGYRQPIYTPSMWLVSKRFALAHWPHAIAIGLIALCLYLTRLFWAELGLNIGYRIAAAICPGKRLSLAMRVLQTRAKLAGFPRVAGRPQRDWLLSLTASHEAIRETARRFCDAADRATFGGTKNSSENRNLENELLTHLKIRTFRHLHSRKTA